MFEFRIIKNSKKSRARTGLIKTENGIVETPCLVPVATQAAVKTLESAEVAGIGSQILICNTFHLHLKPGEEIIEKAGGLHSFMNWDLPLMTDSGGFQVFSLGFGKDLGMGKILKQKSFAEIKENQQPKFLKVTENGVFFRSFLDGKEVFLGPAESIKIQERLGANIIFAFDECTSPVADYEYTRKSLTRTHQWAKDCLKIKKTKQALFGIVQGGRYKDLRIESTRFIGRLPFEGFGIGGEFGNNKKVMINTLNWVIKELPVQKPRHLLGIGYLEDIPKIIKAGVDTFDCIVPTHYARRGIAFISKNKQNKNSKIDLAQAKFLKDKKPLDSQCSCSVCENYQRGYICHLFRANEITAMKLLTLHNLYFFNNFIKKIRKQIKEGKF